MNDFEFVDGRTLSAEELRKVAVIDNAIPADLDPTWSLSGASAEERIEFYGKLTDTDFFKVVYFKGQIVGLHIARSSSQKHLATINSLWVHPDYRRRGLGRALKAKGVEWARSRGHAYLQTSVHVNNERMLEINRKQGFQEFSVNLRLKL